MSRKPQWDIYESVILLEGFLETQMPNVVRQRIVERVSKDLRTMAVHRGIEIDGVYRNENGISYQMSSMESAVLGYKKNIPATKLFKETVNIYQNDKEKYNQILSEARNLIDGKSEEDENETETDDEPFIVWLKSRISIDSIEVLTECYSNINSFSKSIKLVKNTIFDIKDKKRILKIQQMLLGNKEFRKKYKKSIKMVIPAFQYYLSYIEENENDQTKAFGMGVDIDDIKNVYHYAATGNLCDYIQEIGRAARNKDSKGFAILDYYYNDLSFTNALFGMSQIRAYQIKKVLQGIYNVYLSKNCTRNFLISPESFSYIFGKNHREKEDINKLKTCLLMLEKDFYDKYSFKVLISRPQSVFTKAFVVIVKEDEEKVLHSKYGECFKYVEKGREDEPVGNGALVSDYGDIYSVDLKTIWEKYYPNISFPQFKFWYFNQKNKVCKNNKDRVEIMPEVFDSIGLREKIHIEVKGDLLLSDLRNKILEDFEYIADKLYDKCYKRYFQIEEFEKCIVDRYGRMLSKIICASLFELVDPDGRCVKTRNNDSSGKREYYISNGNIKEMMRKKITTSTYVKKLSFVQEPTYDTYTSMKDLEKAGTALKLLSIFDYISYEITGGEEPEIFIRLNDPNKVRDIVQDKIKYTNSYVTKASKKHDRDVQVLRTFFEGLSSDEERWDFIERYFLGYDVLSGTKLEVINKVEMKKSIDKEKSFSTNEFKSWDDIIPYLIDTSFISRLKELSIPIAEYIETSVKKSELGDEILLSWPSKNVIICNPDTPDRVMNIFGEKGWIAFRANAIDYSKLEEVLK